LLLFYRFYQFTFISKPNDERLAKEVPEIDLILGGHDHIVYQKRVGQCLILKSGCNFNEFSYIALDFGKTLCGKETTKQEFEKYNLFIEKVDVDENFPENPELKKYVDDYLKDTEKQMEKVKNNFNYAS